MTLFQSTIYGIIQGLTEFLPVSSSAHLILLPVFTGWPDPGLAFDVALHWGTLAAVVLYYRHDLAVFIRGAIGSLGGGRAPENILPWKIAAATVPGAVIGFAIEHQAETVFRSPWVMVFTLSIMGLVLWWADRVGTKNRHLEDLSWSRAITIGFLQSLALIPGVSRSGITMTACLFLGLERTDAVRFSFLLSIPITAGAGLLKSPYLIHNAGDPTIWAGVITSAVAGFLAIHVLMTYVRTRSFTPFVVYRIALAAVLAVTLLYRG
jgi:undecaprenyl-diphosphatase